MRPSLLGLRQLGGANGGAFEPPAAFVPGVAPLGAPTNSLSILAQAALNSYAESYSSATFCFNVVMV